jgi:GT2 family glycosyltransferase
MGDVSVIIPNWNGKRLLASVCLPSLARQSYTKFTVTVVDNGSEDGSVQFLRSEWPDVNVVDVGHNSGFAAAVNRGIASTTSEFVALVNSDVELDPRWLEELVSAARANPAAGSFACKILDFDDRTLISTVGDCVSDAGSFFWRGHRERDFGQHEEIRPVFSACAGAALYRRDVLADVGPFDEEFFAYAEDVDWGFRSQIMGFGSLYIPSAIAFHIGGATSAGVSGLRYSLLTRNSYWFVIKNFPASVLTRNAHKIAFLITRRFVRLGRQFGWMLSLRTLSDALRGTPSMLRKRRHSRTTQRVTDSHLRAIIEGEGSLGSDKLARLARFRDRVMRSNG